MDFRCIYRDRQLGARYRLEWIHRRRSALLRAVHLAVRLDASLHFGETAETDEQGERGLLRDFGVEKVTVYSIYIYKYQIKSAKPPLITLSINAQQHPNLPLLSLPSRLQYLQKMWLQTSTPFFTQKILKVAEFQEEFGKINYANKIQTSNRDIKSVRLLTAEGSDLLT